MEQATKIMAKVDDTALEQLIIDAIQDIKGQNIIKIDLKDVEDSAADVFIICEGESVTKINAICNNIVRKVKDQMRINPGHLEGGNGAKWILVDYFSVVIHIFYPETRGFYDLEGLWADGKFTAYENV